MPERKEAECDSTQQEQKRNEENNVPSAPPSGPDKPSWLHCRKPKTYFETFLKPNFIEID